jgi:FKBP-type peptidyl-prolyl cis-trans isomerase FklB
MTIIMNVSKKMLASAFCLSAAFSVGAQTPSHATTAHKPATGQTAAPALKTTQDSLSYAIGLSLANFYKQQGITNISTALVVRAVNDVKNNRPLLNDQQAQNCISGYMQKAQTEKASGNIKIGQEFLAANKKKPGVVTTASGLQYLIMKTGTGSRPALTDMVRVHYHGTLIDGKVFDSSVERGQPIELNVNGVIPGWTEALQLMPVGSKWKLFIPANLAYGDRQAGPMITPGSTLIFDVELLDIVKPGAGAPTDSLKSDSTNKPQ